MTTKAARRRGGGPGYASELLEPRRLLAGVTLITHGFGGDTTGWVAAMTNAIDARADFEIDPITYTVTVTDPGAAGGPLDVALSSVAGPVLTDAAAANPEIFILLNWSALAGEFDTETPHRSTVDVAAAVVEKLVDPAFFIGLGGSAIASWPMHLIGHSRGASLVGELALLLGQRGIWVDQVTTLDTHPVDNVNEPNIPLVDLQWGDSTPRATDNVVFWDSYWRTDGNTSYDFTGQPVDGAHNLQLRENLLAEFLAGYGIEHSDAHLWYYGTIDTATTADNGDHAVPTNWYPTSLGMGPRNQIGYFYSRNVGGARPATGVGTPFNGTATRFPVEHTGAQWPNVGQLALEYDQNQTFTTLDSISIGYRYLDLDSDATIWWFADDDQNPDNPGPAIGGGAPLLLGTQSVSKQSFVDTGSFRFAPMLPTGTWHLYARITDGGGRVRYAWLPKAVTIVDAPTPTPETTGQTFTGSVPEGGASSHYVYANAGDMIYATMTRTGNEQWFTPWLGLYAPNGAALAGNWEPVTTSVGIASAPQTGMYRLDARDLSNDASGGYSMTIVHLPATADADDGGLLVSGQTRSASMGVGDLDVFMFRGRAGQSASAVVTRTSADANFAPTVALYGPTGAALDGRWDYLGTGVGRNSLPADGTYFILVRDFYNDTAGSYNITLAVVGGAQDAGGDAGHIQSGETRSGTLGWGDLDVYTFTAGKGQSIQATMARTGGDAAFSPALALYGPDGTLIQSKWDYLGTGVGRYDAPKDGTYYIIANDYGGDATGSYNLTVAVLPEVQHDGGDAGSIASGQTRSATMEYGDIDVFTIDAHIGDSISVVITKTGGEAGFNPNIGLYAPNGVLLDGRWDTVGTGVSELSVTQEGTYYIVVMDNETDATGTYNLSVARVRGAQQIAGDGGAIQSGQTLNGTIGLGDIDVFAFAAQTGQKITATLTETAGGAAFNPYMAVFGPDGAYLHGNWNAAGAGVLVNSAPKTGVYYLVAYDFGGEDWGDYTLSLTLTNTAPPVNSLFTPLDDLLLLRNGGSPGLFDAWINTVPLGTGSPIQSQSNGATTTLDLLGGNDQVTLDFINGAPLAPGSTIDAGPGNDHMRILGTTGADTVTVGSGQLDFGGALNLAGMEKRVYDGRGGADNLSVTGGSLSFDLPQLFASLSINPGATARIAAGGANLLRTGNLSVAGQLDLADNPLIIDYDSASPIDAINALIASGHNGGAWNGAGVISSTTGANHTLAIAEAARVLNLSPGHSATWHGQSVDATTVLVILGLPGDVDLNARIDIDDYFAIDQGYARQLDGYFNGDFNYSGDIDADDYFMIDQAYVGQGSPLSAGAPAPMSPSEPPQFGLAPIEHEIDEDSVLAEMEIVAV